MNYLVLLCCLLFSIPVAATHGKFNDQLEHDNGYLQLLWDTHYVTEGRDNLDGGALQTSVLSLKHGFLELLVWNGWGYDSDYNELNFMPTVRYDYRDLSFYVNYNRLEFTEQGLSDNEIGSGISYGGLVDNLFLDVDWYHSFEANGSFLEFSIASLFEHNDVFRLESRIIIGVNENYIADGHDGLNHFAAQVTGEYNLVDSINLHTKLVYTHPINRQQNTYAGDRLLQRTLQASVGLEFYF